MVIRFSWTCGSDGYGIMLPIEDFPVVLRVVVLACSVMIRMMRATMAGNLVPGVVGEDIELSKHLSLIFYTFKINRKYANVKMNK
jgi:hypothetical protein